MADLTFYDLTYDGPVVQSILDTANDLRQNGYIFRGVLAPTGVVSATTERVWYLCGPGSYGQFGSTTTEVANGEVLIAQWSGSAWTLTVVEVGGGVDGVFHALSDLDGKTTSEKAGMVPDGNVVEEVVDAAEGVETRLMGGMTALAHTATKSGIVYNGNVAGTAIGYYTSWSGYSLYIFDVSAHEGDELAVTGCYLSNGYKYVFCTDWQTIPASKSAYEADPSLWTDNAIAKESSRGASSRKAYNATLKVPEGSVYLILQGYTGIVPTVSYNMEGRIGTELIEPVEEEITELRGTNALVAKKVNKILFAKDGNCKWYTKQGYTCYVYDVTSLVGRGVTFWQSGCNNTKRYMFLSDWESISSTSMDYSSILIAEGAGTSDSTNRELRSLQLGTKTAMDAAAAGSVFLVCHLHNSWGQQPIYGVTGVESLAAEAEGGCERIDKSVLAMHPRSVYAPKIRQMKLQEYLDSKSPKWQPLPVLLAHFSDIHGETSCLRRLVEWCTEFGEIQDIIHTGDSVTATYSDGMAFWNAVEGSEKVLNIIGNHDNDQAGGRTQAECYAQYIEPYVSNWGVTQPEDAATNGNCYWYKDYSQTLNSVSQKVRLIGLDCMHRTTAQLTWLEGVLLDAANNGRTVVIAYHNHIMGSSYATRVECPFTGKEIGSVGAYAWDEAYALVNSFKAGTLTGQTAAGMFACWLCGHAHKDSVLWYTDGQLSIGVDSMTQGQTNRNRGTSAADEAQDCWNLVAIDTVNTTVKLLRVGAGTDDQLREVGQCAIDYTTGKVLGDSFMASAASGITAADITAWNGKVSGTGITQVVTLTESEYEALAVKSATTLYVITEDAS